MFLSTAGIQHDYFVRSILESITSFAGVQHDYFDRKILEKILEKIPSSVVLAGVDNNTQSMSLPDTETRGRNPLHSAVHVRGGNQVII